MRSLRGSVVFSSMSRLCSFGDGFTVAHGWGCSATFVITRILGGWCVGVSELWRVTGFARGNQVFWWWGYTQKKFLRNNEERGMRAWQD